jgi:hypothetical protein
VSHLAQDLNAMDVDESSEHGNELVLSHSYYFLPVLT